MIRIVTDGRRQYWPKYLPYIMYAINTTVNKTTGMMPFVMVIGTQPRGYIDYKSDKNASEEAEIAQRAIELENLHNNVRQKAVEHIKKAKEIQKANQDKQHNILDKSLPLGTTVFIKNEGILRKQDPRFRGPYKVVEVTKRKNYFLEDSVGARILDAYPLHKLKTTANELMMEKDAIDKIVSHRMLNDNFSFLIQWKDDKKKKSWVTEDQLTRDYSELIKDYKTNLKGAKTRNRKKLLGGINLTLLSALCLIFFNIALAMAEDELAHYVNNISVPYCNSNWEKSPIRISQICGEKPVPVNEDKGVLFWFRARESWKQKFSPSKVEKLHDEDDNNANWDKFLELEVYSKLEHNVYGKGYHCKIVYEEYLFSETFWKVRYVRNTKHTVELSDLECWNMIRNKKKAKIFGRE